MTMTTSLCSTSGRSHHATFCDNSRHTNTRSRVGADAWHSTTARWSAAGRPGRPGRGHEHAWTLSHHCVLRHTSRALLVRYTGSPGTAGSVAETATTGSSRDRNFHLVLHQVYKDPQDATPAQLQRLETLAIQRLGELNADSLITVMYAFARTPFKPDARITGQFIDSTSTELPTFTPRQLQHASFCASAPCCSAQAPTALWLTNFSRALDATWGDFQLSGLAETLYAAALVGVELTQRSRDMLRQVAGSSAALERLRFVPAPVLAKLAWLLGHYNCGPLPGPAAELFLRVGSRGPEAGLSTADQVLLLHGVARLDVLPTSEWLGACLGMLQPQLGELDGHMVSLLAWALLRLEAAPGARFKEALVDRFADCLVVGSGRPQDAAVTLSCLAGMGMRGPDTGTVDAYLRAHAEELSGDARTTLLMLGYQA